MKHIDKGYIISFTHSFVDMRENLFVGPKSYPHSMTKSNSELLTYITRNITEFSMTSRKMFGGIGVFSGGVMFALTYDGILYLKSTAEIAKIYAKESTPFQPPFRPSMKMPYWSVPANILRDRHRLVEWAQQALDYAKTTKKKKLPTAHACTSKPL